MSSDSQHSGKPKEVREPAPYRPPRLNALAMAKNTGSLSENVNYAVKGSQLRAFLAGLPMDNNSDESGSSKPTQVAESGTIQRVKNATVFITAKH